MRVGCALLFDRKDKLASRTFCPPPLQLQPPACPAGAPSVGWGWVDRRSAAQRTSPSLSLSLPYPHRQKSINTPHTDESTIHSVTMTEAEATTNTGATEVEKEVSRCLASECARYHIARPLCRPFERGRARHARPRGGLTAQRLTCSQRAASCPFTLPCMHAY